MARKTKEDALVVKNDNIMIQEVPEFMKGDANKGTELISPSDMEIPRIKLIQELSDEKNAYDDAEPGKLFHTVGDLVLNAPLSIIPVFIHQTYILWRPRHMGGGIIARADDGVHWQPSSGEHTIRPSKDSSEEVVWKLEKTVELSGFSEWGSYNSNNPESQPAATKIYNIVVVLPDHLGLSPVVLPLQRSQIKVARRFISKVRMVKAASFGQVYELGTFLDHNNANQEFWNYKFSAIGLLNDEDQYNAMKEWYEHFSAEGLRVQDLEGMEDEAPLDVTPTGPGKNTDTNI